jgi:hypothetical protein
MDNDNLSYVGSDVPYARLGALRGAGSLRDKVFVPYIDTTTGERYVREEGDFVLRMSDTGNRVAPGLTYEEGTAMHFDCGGTKEGTLSFKVNGGKDTFLASTSVYLTRSLQSDKLRDLIEKVKSSRKPDSEFSISQLICLELIALNYARPVKNEYFFVG